MKYLSVCSGIEAASVAWHPLGWEPVAFSEIEPFPSAVLAHHYPNVPNLGDMTKFQEWPDEPVDLLVGGTPCQSFSVAGLRKGLEDPRGNLMLTYLAIAQRYRPRWLVWENVPGVLSSNGGRDFGTFLGALGELGYGWAYRVLDAQWFGVAQRRRRVFVVGHLGDWQRAAQVLFERESVRRDTPPRREARQGAATGFVPGLAGSLDTECGGGKLTHQSVANGHLIGTITARMFNALGARDVEEGALLPVAFHNRQDPDVSGDITHPLGAKDNGMAVAQPVAFRDPCPTLTAKMQGSSGWAPQNEDAHLVGVAQPVYGTDCYNGAITGDVAATLGTPGSSVNASGPTVMQPVATDLYNGAIDGDATHSLRVGNGNAMGGVPSVMQPVATVTDMRGLGDGHVAPTLRAKETANDFTPMLMQPMATDIKQVQWASGGGQLENDTAQALRSNAEHNYQFARIAMQVRRLTPVECERLQGFPDGYTNIPWRKKPEAPDGPRYKALGNSMAVPCMAWIGKRIAEVDRGD